MATIRQDNDTKVFLVTGATGAIGKAIAQRLADIEGSEVVLVCRDKLKAEKAVNEIIGITNNPRVRSELADLGRHQDIRELAGRWAGPSSWSTMPPARPVTDRKPRRASKCNLPQTSWVIFG